MRCPNCQNKGYLEYKIINSYRLLRCAHCDILYTRIDRKTKLSEVNINKYNSNYYKNYLARGEKYISRYILNMNWLSKFKDLRNSKFLDIGCGAGTLLDIIKKQYSDNVYGIDPNEYLVDHCRMRNLGIIKKAKMNSLPFDDNMFDCITCFDVLEHSAMLKKNLFEINIVLKFNGFLVIQCPNYKSLMQFACGDLWDWWCPPDHIIHFSKSSLRRVLFDRGFDLIFIKTYDDLIDYIKNIKGALRKRGFNKISTIMLLLLFIIIRPPLNYLGYGGLTYIILKKNNICACRF